MNTVAWASAPLLLSEMAPTTIRNMSYGFVSTIGEVGSVLAPYMKRIVKIEEKFFFKFSFEILRGMKINKKE